VLVNGKTFTSDLAQIAEGRAAFGAKSWPLTEIVRWGNPVAPRAQTIVVLANGGQLVTAADWSGGAAARLERDVVVVLSDTFGEVRLPREVVSGLVFAQRRSVRAREELVQRVRGGRETEPSPNPVRPRSPQASLKGRGKGEDAVLLTNGDWVSGKLVQLERGSLTIETASGAAKLPLSRIDAIKIGERTEPSPNPSLKGRGIVVGLRDGSLLYVDQIEAGARELRVKAAGWEAAGSGNASDVVSLQQIGGPVVYLSNLEPASYRHVPYLSIEWPYRRDRNVEGGPLVVGGKRYLKGIGMHSAARLTYPFGGKYKRFDAAVAIDDTAERHGSVTFAVYVIRDGKLQEAYKSDVVRGGEPPRQVSVDVSGAESLTLVVDYADRGDEMDRADWLDARLLQ
jgi:hypothetical protein